MLRGYYFWTIGLFYSVFGFSQTVLNNRYDLDLDAASFGAIQVNDSCYYVIGIAGVSPTGPEFGVCFSKIYADGDIGFATMLWNDSVTVYSCISNTLIPSLDGNLVALANANPYHYYLIKYAPNGDTIFTTVVNYFQPDNKKVIRSTSVIELEEDSSFTCLGWLQEIPTGPSSAALFNLSKTGDLNWTKYIDGISPVYPSFWPMKMLRHADGGYLISGCLRNNVSSPEDEDARYHIHLVKTDDSGNVEWRQTYYDNPYNFWGMGLTPAIDGGYLFCGLIGEYFSGGSGSVAFKGHLIKLKSDFTLDWEKIMGYAWGSDEFELYEILTVSDSTFVTAGSTVISGVGSAGQLIKFNLNGDILWESNIIKVPWVTGELPPEHVFYDVAQTPDNGFIMVGEAVNFESTYEPIGQHGWVVKTDSFGCIVPNCQDVLKLDPIEYPVVIRTYPNPVRNELNLFYHDTQFTSAAELVIVDLNGREINRWKLSANDMTYIFEVNQMGAGTYLLQVLEKGEVRVIEKIIKE